MKKYRGFTLIELALVLVVVAFLLGFSITLMQSLSRIERSKKTEANLKIAKDALIGFFLKNKRFPYADNNDDGVMDANTYKGKLPYRDLGLVRNNAADAYGFVFSYDVSNELTSTQQDTICSKIEQLIDGTITSQVRITSDRGSSFTEVPYIIMSSGNNKVLDGENNDGDSNYEISSANIDDMLEWSSFLELYRYIGCGNNATS